MTRLLVDARVGWGSGIGRFIVNAVPGVARAMSDARFDVMVEEQDARRAAAELGEVPNIAVRPVGLRAFSPREQIALPKMAARYDLTWFTNYWVPLAWKGPFVTTVHDLLHLDRNLFPASLMKRALARQTFAKVRRDARAVMFDSRFSERVFHDRIGLPAASHTVHLGIDHRDWPAIPPRPWIEKERRIVVVAAAKAHKNFRMILDAWTKADIPPDWCLTIVTPNEQLRSSIDVAALAAGQRSIDLRQGIGNTELRDLYDAAAVVVTPSLYEGFGFPLLEGLQAGAWCISSTADSMVEMAEGTFAQFVNGRDLEGWITALEDTCAAIDQNRFDHAPLVARNIERVSRYRWAVTCDQIVAVLRDALAPTTIRA
ncbi:glycosyltransferase family 1 protein [Sphingomonas cynarae]|uniref:Glycosyltransferase family 1 protein n=1 Tax=Sphingomonas cynarae TaxID=930197 RepID=A0ABP7EQC7_9SPHN